MCVRVRVWVRQCVYVCVCLCVRTCVRACGCLCVCANNLSGHFSKRFMLNRWRHVALINDTEQKCRIFNVKIMTVSVTLADKPHHVTALGAYNSMGSTSLTTTPYVVVQLSKLPNPTSFAQPARIS